MLHTVPQSMPRRAALSVALNAPSVRGLISLLAGLTMISQPVSTLTAQTPSQLTSPVRADSAFAASLTTTLLTVTVTARPTFPAAPGVSTTVTPTPAYTPPPTFTPQPTFTPLPPTLTPMPISTPTSPFAPLVTGPMGLIIDPTVLLVIGGLAFLVLLLTVLRIAQNMQRKQRASQSTAPVRPIAPPPPVTASLEFVDIAGKPVHFPLDKPSCTLGRAADNDLIVPETVPQADTVSHHHAQFRRDQDDYIVRDLGSQNGLMVNGRHTNHNLLQDGDRIGFGGAEAIFRGPTGNSPSGGAA
jgi:hypothetical protein